MFIDSSELKKVAEDNDASLVTQYQSGDNKALNELIRRHDDLLKFRTSRYKNMPVPLPAVYGQSMKILANAAQRFDPNQDVKFRTYLESNLKGLNRYSHQNKNVLHFPQNKMENIAKFKEAADLLSQQYGRPPTDWQLSDALGWSIPEIREFRRKLAQGELAASGLTNVVGKEQDIEALQARSEERAEFLYFTLTPEQKLVYDLALGRHGRPKLNTDADIAKVTKLSPSKVNRIRKDLARKIQQN